MRISKLCLIKWEKKFWIMRLKVIIVVYSHTDKPEAGKVIPWSDMALTKYILVKNKGIVPITCDEIFKRIQLNSNDKISYEV
jgi:hypothetical protein